MVFEKDLLFTVVVGKYFPFVSFKEITFWPLAFGFLHHPNYIRRISVKEEALRVPDYIHHMDTLMFKTS